MYNINYVLFLDPLYIKNDEPELYFIYSISTMDSELIIYNLYSVIVTKSLKNRKEYHRYITNYLRRNTYTILKQIGSYSKNASVFTCCGKGPAKILKFVCKYYAKCIFNDINLSIRLSALVLYDINPHFNIVYKYHNGCLLVELAQGDLKQFLQKRHSFDVLVNCLQQILICILSFHKHAELCHNDCYHGNFLYHKLSRPGGHIQYKIHDKAIYIKNLGYLWVINDFDMVSEEDEDTNMYNDYIIAMEAFVNYNRNAKFRTFFHNILTIIHDCKNSKELFNKLQCLWSLTEPKYKKKIINTIPYIL